VTIKLEHVRADPILVEVLRTRLEAIGQEAGMAVEQTAISPIVTESRDYSVTICNADGDIVSCTGVVESHFGAATHAIHSTIARYGEDVADGDVFIANDPHTGGGLHPQDVIVQRPVFAAGKLVAWVALAAHMMDIGGMVPGSSAVLATECIQEALRLPPVRLVRQDEEASNVWEIIRNNIRTPDKVEMDIRSLVIGGHVAGRKLVELIGEFGPDVYAALGRTLIDSTRDVLRERIGHIEDGAYTALAGVEFREDLLTIPCTLTVAGDRIEFDLSQAPPQVPHFINSKSFTISAVAMAGIRCLLAPGLPVNQAIYDVIELKTVPGSIVDSVFPAPIGAAHMDCAMAVSSAMAQCLQLAIHASPDAWGREYNTAPPNFAYATGRWSHAGPRGARQVFTLLDGAFWGSGAAHDRDGVDLHRNLVPTGTAMENADIEILETAYPLLFRWRSGRLSSGGYGEYRGGAGCTVSFTVHHADDLVGNLTGSRSWFPTGGAAGGLPGGLTRYSVRHADGTEEPVDVHAVGLRIAPGDQFQLMASAGGGFGDPLDRPLDRVAADIGDGRLEGDAASEVYGVEFALDGTLDADASERRRNAIRQDRLARSAPPARPADGAPPGDLEALPLYPGVVQRGAYAVAERSGAVLAIAPGDWLEGCRVIETAINNAGRDLVTRAYIDPVSGRQLFFETVGPGVGRSVQVAPARWTTLQVRGRTPLRQGRAGQGRPTKGAVG
jgi:N-methylhydantoinase B